jgi:hypothetical protein
MTALKDALSWMPFTRMAVTMAVTITAGRFTKPLVAMKWPVLGSYAIGARAMTSGRWMPIFGNSDWKKLDQPLATVAEPTAYSSTRSQPMIQANISPSVAYA